MRACYGKADHFATFGRLMFAGFSNLALKSTCNWNTRVPCMRTMIGPDVSFCSTSVCLRTHPAAFCLSAYLNDGMSMGSRLERPILLAFLGWECQILKLC